MKADIVSVSEHGLADLYEGRGERILSFKGSFLRDVPEEHPDEDAPYPFSCMNIYSDGEIWLTDSAVCHRLRVNDPEHAFFAEAYEKHNSK